MQTSFLPERLRLPHIAEADAILRKCVHCGFCTATCPTYLLEGNELSSPRGRIWLIKELLEGRAAPAPEVSRHLDGCLTCLSCMTTCPSGVDYEHLLEIGRAELARAPASRPLAARFWRRLLRAVVPYPRRFAAALRLGRLFAPLAGLLEAIAPARPGAALLRLARRAPAPEAAPSGAFAPAGERRARVALLAGCAQSVLAARINRASIDLLALCGAEVVIPETAGCCGALSLHMGAREEAAAMSRANIAAWEGADVEAVLVNASGCGVVVKDYGHLLKDDPAWASRAAAMAEKSFDIGEWLLRKGPPPMRLERPPVVALHAPCTLTHGQKLAHVPRALLERAGFTVVEPEEAHICCGAAGVHSILQPDTADPLGRRKARHLEATGAELVASANYACMNHIQRFTTRPVVHYLDLLAWAAGGTPPPSLANRG